MGRMKAEMITINVLGPKTVQDILNDLSPTEDKPATNGNRKMFPVCVRYFSVSDEVWCKLLDFYENKNETANGIHQALMNWI